jgi:putative ABC transport system permease protein
VRSLLVVAEVALALVLLLGAGLMIKSFLRLQGVEAGFNPRGVLTMVVSVAGSQQADPARRETFYRQLLERVGALPGVESASAINHLPLAGDTWTLGLTIDGRPQPAPGTAPTAIYRVVHHNYFQTMRMTVLRGRGFTDRDVLGAPGVVVVNEAFVRRHFPDEEPIGKRVRLAGGPASPHEIVGVVKDAKQDDWAAEPRREAFFPLLQSQPYLQNPSPWYNYITLVVRTASDPLGLVSAVQNEVWAIDRNLPVSQVQSMEQVVAAAVGRPRFNTLLLGLFAAVALALASVGIYGVMSYAVAQRTHELGIRMALGARGSDVLRLVVGQGLRLVLVGVGAGLVAAFGLTRLMASLLYGVSAHDPATFAAIALLLTAVALVACYLPARRATKVDPMVALRYE